MTSIEERFFQKVKKTDTCWIWQGGRNNYNYGRTTHQGKRCLIHRLMFCLFNQLSLESIADKVVMHSCDNPPCVNPGHLRLGTIADNNKDMVLKGRQVRGETQGSSKFSNEQIREIRQAPKTAIKSLIIKFGVNPRTIHRIRQNKVWRHIEAV